MPATIAGNTATFTITDGGLGDDDRAANGAIVDQGGPGVPGGAGATAIPTLSEWAMLALMGLAARVWRLAAAAAAAVLTQHPPPARRPTGRRDARLILNGAMFDVPDHRFDGFD